MSLGQAVLVASEACAWFAASGMGGSALWA
jgi:hypothetical protein